MILEIALIQIIPGKQEEFESAVKQAVSEVLSKAVGFIDFKLHRGIEDSNSYTFHIHWQSLEDHTVVFRESQEFTQWRSMVSGFYAVPSIVHHWNLVQ
jgi:heme-degrading monooxygenase HmoA